MDKDQYYAQVGAKIASGKKIAMEDAWKAQAQAEFYDRFLNGKPKQVSQARQQTYSSGSSTSSGSDDTIVILLVLAAVALFLFLGCPYLAWTMLWNGNYYGLIFLGVTVASYGGTGFWIWYEKKEDQKRIIDAEKVAIEKEQEKILNNLEFKIATATERLAEERLALASVLREQRYIVKQAKKELDTITSETAALKQEQAEINQWNAKHGAGRNLEEVLQNLKQEIIGAAKEKAALETIKKELWENVSPFELVINAVESMSIESIADKATATQIIVLKAVLNGCGEQFEAIRSGQN